MTNLDYAVGQARVAVAECKAELMSALETVRSRAAADLERVESSQYPRHAEHQYASDGAKVGVCHANYRAAIDHVKRLEALLSSSTVVA